MQGKTKPDDATSKVYVGMYFRLYDGMTRAELLEQDPALYRALRDAGRLDAVPKTFTFTTSPAGFTYVGTVGVGSGAAAREHAWYRTAHGTGFYRETTCNGQRRLIREPDDRVPAVIRRAVQSSAQ